MICPICSGQLKGTAPGIHGTRDGFGIKNAFRDGRTGMVVDTWKKWEKAGYKEPKDDPTLKGTVKAQVLRKMDKIKYDTKKKFNVKVK